MRIKLKGANLVILVMLVICQNMIAGQKLRYQFEKGKSYSYSANIDITESAFRFSFDFTIDVIDAKEGVYTFILTLQRLEGKINMPGLGINDTATRERKEYIGKRMKIIMTDRGKTISIEPIDMIAPSRYQKVGNTDFTPDPASLFKQFMIQFPEEEMDLNSSWKINTPDTTLFNAVVMVKEPNIGYTITGIEKKKGFDCWKITFRGASTSEGSGSQHGNDRTIDQTDIVSGSAYFAQAKGIFVFFEQLDDSDLKISDTLPQKNSMEMSYKISFKVSYVN